MNREEAFKIIRAATGDALPKQGDSLTFSINGQFEFIPFGLAPVKNVTSSYSVEGRDVMILASASSSNTYIYLPPAEYAVFRVLIVKRIDSSIHDVVIEPYGSQTVDGASSTTLTDQWDSVMVVSDGSNWFIV